MSTINDGYYEVKVIDIISGKNKMVNKVTEIERARRIAKSLGNQVAARYLRKRNWSIESAMWLLAGK